MPTRNMQRLSARTEALAMRFDPQIKYMADLVSRQERRSLTSFVEWAIDRALREVQLVVSGHPMPAAEARNLLWDIDEVERLRKLVQHCPSLLRYEDQVLMNQITEFETEGPRPMRFAKGGEIDWALVKACWEDLKGYAMAPELWREPLTAALQAARPAAIAAKRK